MRILQNYQRGTNAATVAQVTFSEGGGYGALSASEHRSVPVFGPRGIAYRPCEGDHLLLVKADGADACAGVLVSAEDIQPGELRLASSGGASIRLCADGKIVLNGVTITPEGNIVLPEGGAVQ